MGCGIKMEYLPQVSYPYVAEMDFLKGVKNVDGKARKKRFKNDRITVPFYFLLKVNDIENNGSIAVRFYESPEPLAQTGNVPAGNVPEQGQAKKAKVKEAKAKEAVNAGEVVNAGDAAKPEESMGRQVVERTFQFGQPGKYYEYVIFFDRVDGINAGKYQYAVFYNDKLIYESFLNVNTSAVHPVK